EELRCSALLRPENPLGVGISERSQCKVKGLTMTGSCRRIGPVAVNSAGSTNAMAKKPPSTLKPETRLVTAGRDTKGQHGFVNPAVYHASTVLYPTAADQIDHRARYQYGRRGTPTSEALEDALREMEGE